MPGRTRGSSRPAVAAARGRDGDPWRALLESIGTPVLVVRPPMVIAAMNDAARELTGVDLDADVAGLMTAMDPRDAWTDEPVGASVLRAALAGEDVVRDVSFTELRGRARRAARVSARPMRARDGRVVAAVVALHDLTELRHAEEEKDAFLSLVAHELRTPLTPLKALAQLQSARLLRARERGETPDLVALERNLRTLERQVDRLNGLVSDLLSVSRARRGALVMERRSFDLAASIRGITGRWAQAARDEGRHAFTVDAPDSLVIVADQARIEQLLANLLGNAVKYSPRGGEVRVALTREGASARIAITDQGIGIEPADLARLGAPFTQGSGRAATFAGMGIGLYVAKLVAEAHGGSLELESAGADRGTTVRVRLPDPLAGESAS